ncbi:ABC transporter substrate-binding protein [Sinorhizobium meliloti]|uniref:ABC transporter substrate-binding protein n=1 Tax=Rhizobium meliloti TaxID=382 RepID=UPI0030D2FC8F
MAGDLRKYALTRRALLCKAGVAGVMGTLGAQLLGTKAIGDTRHRGGKLIVGVKGGSTGDTLDPTIIPYAAMAFVVRQFGNYLINRTSTGELEGELAECWEAQDEGKRWVVKLKRGITFHNGREFTSADMLYSLDRHRGRDSKSPARALMKQWESVTADGPYQLTISLKEPDVGLPYLLTYVHLVAQPKDESPDGGIGTGPFILVTAEPGKRYTFRRNPNYFKPDGVRFDELEVLVINDDTARVSALLSGSVHLMTDVPPNLAANLRSKGNINIVTTPGAKFHYYVMQVDKPPFDNPDLRLALKYAIDREAILKNIAAGYGEIGNDQPVNSVYPLHADDLPMRTYDVEKAAALYKRSGHTGPIELHTAEIFPGAVDMSVLFQQSAAKAGITIDLKREPVDGYWTNVWMRVPLCQGSWGSLTAEDQALSLTNASDAPWNAAHWRNPHFDEVLTQARTEFDPKARKSRYREASLLVQENSGYLMVMHPYYVEAMSEKIDGYVSYPFGENAKNTQNSWFTT